MENFYKRHQGFIFFIGVTASVVVYAFTTFATQKSVDQYKTDTDSKFAELKSDLKDIKQDIKELMLRRSGSD